MDAASTKNSIETPPRKRAGRTSSPPSPPSPKWVNPTPVAVRDEFEVLMSLLINEFKVIRQVHPYPERVCDTMYVAVGSGINAVTGHHCSAQELRDIAAAYICDHPEHLHYKKYIGVTEASRIQYCSEIQDSKLGLENVELAALASCLNVIFKIHKVNRASDGIVVDTIIGDEQARPLYHEAVELAYLATNDTYHVVEKLHL